MRRLLCTLLLMAITVLVFVSCTQENIYLPDPDTWRAGDRTFNTFSEAVKYLASYTPKGMAENTIFLLRDVSGNEYGEPIVVPKIYSTDRDLSIDLGNHEYRFDGSKDGYLVKEGGKTLEIMNGFFALTQNAGSSAVFKTEQGSLVLVSSLTVRDGRPNSVLLDATDSNVEFSSGSFTGDIRINNSCVEITGGTVNSRSVKAEGSETAPASVIISGGHFETAALELGTFTTFDVSGNNSVVFVRNITMKSGSETQIRGGDMTFGNDIAKNPEAVFEITGGTVSNPHRIDSLVLEAIAEGGSPEDVIHTLIHDPFRHPEIPATCHEEGLEEYWSCNLCDMLFSDEECKHQIEEPQVIPQLEHQLTPDWQTSDYSHYYQCVLCGDIFDEAEHEWSELVDNKKHCLVCGFEIDMDTHVHWFPIFPQKKDYKYDEAMHWLQCSCGLHKDDDYHEWGPWRYSNEDEVEIRDCEVCGFTEQRTEPHEHIVDVGFGEIIYPDNTRTLGKLKSETIGNEHTVWFEPYGNTNPDYILSCWYKVGVQKIYVHEDENRRFIFSCDQKCTVYLQISSAGGTITRNAELSPR